MKLKVIVHEADEGGYWAQGETFQELLQNLYEAVEGCLSVDIDTPRPSDRQKILEIIV